MLNSVKYKIVLVGLVFSAFHLLAEPLSYRVAKELPEEFLSKKDEFASELKLEAVVEKLMELSGDNFDKLTQDFDSKFAERYVLDFRRKTYTENGKVFLEVKGHIDGDGLKKWLEAALPSGQSTKLLWVFSSEFPSMETLPQETSSAVKNKTFVRTLAKLSHKELRNYGAKLMTKSLRRLPVRRPPTRRDDIAALRQLGALSDADGAIWSHLKACFSCGGAQVDYYFYDFRGSSSPVQSRADLKLAQSDLEDSEKLEKMLEPTVLAFTGRIRSHLGRRTQYADTLKMHVKGASYTHCRAVEDALRKLDFVNQALLSSVDAETAVFEVKTALKVGEFRKRLEGVDFSQFRLKVLRVDGTGLVVRYWKPKS